MQSNLEDQIVDSEKVARVDVDLHDHDFYITADQLTIFQVEGRLFKVHRHFLTEHSPVFRDMFALPTSSAGEIEGDSDAHPIHLSGVTILEFKSLMKVLYRSHQPDFHQLSHPEWLAVLAIAHRFEFQTVHERAVQNLRTPPSSAEAVPLLVAAERYGIDFANIIDALRMVVERSATLEETELDNMSSKLISCIMSAREKLRSATSARCSRCAKSRPNADSIIRSTWDIQPTPPSPPEDDADFFM